jgi:hypothetical protein
MQAPVPALLIIAALALIPAGARADDKPTLKPLYDVALDLDHDGRLDRAVVVHDPASIYAALYIYLGAGNGPLDIRRRPSFVKKDLTTDPVTGLAANGHALVVKYGRVGLGSNQYEMSLTIMRRRGEFWVTRFTASWDMRDGSLGSCAIDFLRGKGVAARGHGRNKRVRAKLTPIKLADWSEDKRPNACK